MERREARLWQEPLARDTTSVEGGVKSVEVAGRLLKAMAAQGIPLHLADLSKLAGMPPAKAHRYLASLIEIGLVNQNPEDRRYNLGRFALELGAVALRSFDPLTEAIERLHCLRHRVDETFTLAIWSASGPIVLQVEESSRPIMMTMKRGTVLPMLSSATGIVFCALLPENQTDALIERELQDRGNSNPIVKSRDELARLLEDVRRNGYALNSGHLLPDVVALAAPIYDGTGSLTAVLGVFGHENRIDPSRDRRMLNTLLAISRTSLSPKWRPSQ